MTSSQRSFDKSYSSAAARSRSRVPGRRGHELRPHSWNLELIGAQIRTGRATFVDVAADSSGTLANSMLPLSQFLSIPVMQWWFFDATPAEHTGQYGNNFNATTGDAFLLGDKSWVQFGIQSQEVTSQFWSTWIQHLYFGVVFHPGQEQC